MSFGLATLGGPASTSADEEKMVTRIYQAADEALYEAKEGGRNCVAVQRRPVAWSRTVKSVAPQAIAV
jgi:GGDEF domain-containing protein